MASIKPEKFKTSGSLVSLPETHPLARQLGLHEKKEKFFGLHFIYFEIFNGSIL